MHRQRFIFSLFLSLLFLAGCSSLTYTPAPTSFPADYIPTVIALTVRAGEQALITPSPVVAVDTLTPTSTPTILPTDTWGPSPTSLAYNPTSTPSIPPSATRTPDLSATATPNQAASRTPTPTRTPTIPLARVQVSNPGPMSKVASPLQLEANMHSIPSGSYRLEILAEQLRPSEEPRLLYREVHRIVSYPADWIYLDIDIQFELSRVSEFGQLRISVFDRYDRPAWVGSVDLILLSIGKSEITAKGLLTEPIVIREPTPNHLIQGGVVIVSGEALPTDAPLLAELVTYEGTVVGYRQVFLPASPDGSYVPFAVEVPYSVSKPTWVRLLLSESGTRIPGIEHLSSVELLLSP